MIRHTALLTAKLLRRLLIGAVGLVVLATGVALLVLPGPAIVVIPMGLVILSLEFAWARHLLRKLRERLSNQAEEPIGRAPARGGSGGPEDSRPP